MRIINYHYYDVKQGPNLAKKLKNLKKFSPRRSLDTSRALEEFGYKARTPLREGLKKTIDWYMSNRGTRK